MACMASSAHPSSMSREEEVVEEERNALETNEDRR